MHAFCLLKRKQAWAPVSRYFLTTADLASGSGWAWSHLPTIQEVKVLVVAWGRGKKNLGTKSQRESTETFSHPVSPPRPSADAHRQHSNTITTKTSVPFGLTTMSTLQPASTHCHTTHSITSRRLTAPRRECRKFASGGKIDFHWCKSGSQKALPLFSRYTVRCCLLRVNKV